MKTQNEFQRLMPFNFDGEKVRTLIHNGNPAFVVSDVCRVLGIANSKDAFSRLHEDERDGVGITDSIGRSQITQICYEPGVYRLIFASRKPEAERFKDWVFHVVLPALRKAGLMGATREELKQALRKMDMVDYLKEHLAELDREPELGIRYVELMEYLNERGIEAKGLHQKSIIGKALRLECQRQNLLPICRALGTSRFGRRLWPMPVLEAAIKQAD